MDDNQTPGVGQPVQTPPAPVVPTPEPTTPPVETPATPEPTTQEPTVPPTENPTQTG